MGGRRIVHSRLFRVGIVATAVRGGENCNANKLSEKGVVNNVSVRLASESYAASRAGSALFPWPQCCVVVVGK